MCLSILAIYLEVCTRHGLNKTTAGLLVINGCISPNGKLIVMKYGSSWIECTELNGMISLFLSPFLQKWANDRVFIHPRRHTDNLQLAWDSQQDGDTMALGDGCRPLRSAGLHTEHCNRFRTGFLCKLMSQKCKSKAGGVSRLFLSDSTHWSRTLFTQPM